MSGLEKKGPVKINAQLEKRYIKVIIECAMDFSH